MSANTAQALYGDIPRGLRNQVLALVREAEQRGYRAGVKAGEKRAMERVVGLIGNDKAPQIIEIQQRVADHFGIQIIEMGSHRRGRVVTRPRQVAIYLCRRLTPYSMSVIGHHFGGRDHTTVIHSINMVGILIERDRKLAADIDALEASFTKRVA